MSNPTKTSADTWRNAYRVANEQTQIWKEATESYERYIAEVWGIINHENGSLKEIIKNLVGVYEAAKKWRHATDSPRQFPQSIALEKAIDKAKAYEDAGRDFHKVGC